MILWAVHCMAALKQGKVPAKEMGSGMSAAWAVAMFAKAALLVVALFVKSGGGMSLVAAPLDGVFGLVPGTLLTPGGSL
jgi:hypothetical protein